MYSLPSLLLLEWLHFVWIHLYTLTAIRTSCFFVFFLLQAKPPSIGLQTLRELHNEEPQRLHTAQEVITIGGAWHVVRGWGGVLYFVYCN